MYIAAVKFEKQNLQNKAIPFFKVASKSPNYLEINLTTYEQNPYTENYKMFVRINFKMSKFKNSVLLMLLILGKLTYKFNIIPFKPQLLLLFLRLF